MKQDDDTGSSTCGWWELSRMSALAGSGENGTCVPAKSSPMQESRKEVEENRAKHKDWVRQEQQNEGSRTEVITHFSSHL